MKKNIILSVSFRLIYLFIASLIIIFSLNSCTKNFNEINTPENVINADKIDIGLLGPAFAQAQYEGMIQQRTLFQVMHNLFCDHYAQYFATTHPNFPSDQFQEPSAWTGDYGWDYIYSIPLPQLYFVDNFTKEKKLDLAHAMTSVWKVEVYHRLTDIWGPIIYSQFGNGKKNVEYDSQEDIYHSFFKTLDTAVAILKQHTGGTAFGNNDLVYRGDANKWLIFANSLRLRLAMRIAYVEPTLARSEAEKAVVGGVMTKNEDNANVLTTLNSLNGYAKITYINEFRMTATMESVMVGFADPRISEYFAPAEVGGGYKGIRNGLTVADKGDRLNLQATHSFIGQKWRPIANGGTNPPLRVMCASEVYFLRAEGALRGWNMNGTVQELYNEGIRKSLTERTAASPSDIENYVNSLNKPSPVNDKWNTPAMSDITVVYQPARTFEKKLEQIITQKWIAIYPDSYEAWAERRRTGYPVGYPIIKSLNPDVPENAQMRRLTFAIGEYTTNGPAVEAAKGKLGGPNNNATKLWWDAK
ncbi:MAG: SusD/RagB family nutrient-binding outer membrane lipoprotein [Ginsengibacter sp.]